MPEPSVNGDCQPAVRVFFVCACNSPAVFERHAARSVGVQASDIHRFDNCADNRPVPVRYNQFIDGLTDADHGWVAFAHNDFAFLEDPRPWLARVSRDAFYGVIGAAVVSRPRAGSAPACEAYVVRGQVACSPQFFAPGLFGAPVAEPVPVATVDCCCIMIHTDLIRRNGLRFDESFEWHQYSEELSLRARREWGIETVVLPVRSGHYGMGGIDERFRRCADRLKAEYGDRFVSTCFNPLAVTPSPSTGDPAAPTLALTVVVVVHRMSHQAMRTLHSLSPSYQRGISEQQYEVLVMENASDDPLPADFIFGLPPNFRHTWLDTNTASPLFALNRGLREARGKIVGAMIDGARLVTPGLLRRALFASRLHPASVVTTMGWYLGFDTQGDGLLHGHSTAREDDLLASIHWPKDPYRLFEISTPDQSSVDGWVAPMGESNAIFLSRDAWWRLGGFDERFVSPGGGLANLDLFKRACEMPKAQQVLLSDEATFHQNHGGIATNAPPASLQEKLERWCAEYRAIHGVDFQTPDQRSRVLYGALRPQIAAHLASALLWPVRTPLRLDSRGGGYLADREQWPVRRLPPPAAPKSARAQGAAAAIKPLTQFAQQLFSQSRFVDARDVCRLALARYGHGRDIALERLLGQCANVSEDLNAAPPRRRSQHCATMATARQLIGDLEEAKALLDRAIAIDPANDLARFELSSLQLPGEIYLGRLSDVHEFLAPRVYLEIGVFRGDSMALARPPALAFGVDPVPALTKPCRVETRIYPLTSDQFFQQNLKRKLILRRVDFAFIDGLHDFMQVVRDFWNAERLCDTNSVVAFHDTLPLDEASSTKARTTGFWTGDVWKIIPFLMQERPDLRVVTVRTPPSGLTLVSGLRPWQPVSLELTMERAAAYDALPYDSFDRQWRPRMHLLENTRAALGAWLLTTSRDAQAPSDDAPAPQDEPELARSEA